MGKGTNYDKRPTILDGIVLAGKLLKHTRDIIKNEKVFDPKRDFQNRGFIYKMTKAGKVLMLRDPQRIRETRRKYRRLANRIARGEIAAYKLDDSYQGVRACMEKGTNRRLIRRMDDFIDSLKGELENAT